MSDFANQLRALSAKAKAEPYGSYASYEFARFCENHADAIAEAVEALEKIATEQVGDMGWQGTALAQRAHARKALARLNGEGT